MATESNGQETLDFDEKSFEFLLPELIAHIFTFLGVPDRKEAALVCKNWHAASLDPILQKDVIVKYQAPKDSCFMTTLPRRITHLVLQDFFSDNLNEYKMLALLDQCPCLKELDMSKCNSIFISGRLLVNENDRVRLKDVLKNVEGLKLERLTFITDVTFLRLISVFENLSSISLAKSNVIFESNQSTSVNNSAVIFRFSCFLKFVENNAKKIKSINLSKTNINDEALNDLSNIPGLCLEEAILKRCMLLTDKGIEHLGKGQRQLKLLDLAGSGQVGESGSLFKILVQYMQDLHTLILRKCPCVSMSNITTLGHLSLLRELDLRGAVNLLNYDLMTGFSCNPSFMLTSLCLAYCPEISDDFVSNLGDSSPNLKLLDLTACDKITDLSLFVIAKKLLSLRVLKLALCPRLTDLGLLGALPVDYKQSVMMHDFEFEHTSCNCERPKESRIFRKPTGILLKHYQSAIDLAKAQSEAGDPFYKLSNLKLLQTLDLSKCSKITDVGISKAIRFKGLRFITLNYLTNLTDKSIENLSRKNPSLESVSVQGCTGLTDMASRAIATNLPRLTTLNISQNDHLTDASLFVVLSKSKRLTKLNVSYCQRIDVDTAVNLDLEFKNVRILLLPHLYSD